MAVNIKSLENSVSNLSLSGNVSTDLRIAELINDPELAAQFQQFLKTNGLIKLEDTLGKGAYGKVISAQVAQNSPLLAGQSQNEVAIKIMDREKAEVHPKSFLITKDRQGAESLALKFPDNQYLLKTYSLITYNLDTQTFQIRIGDLSNVDNELILGITMEKLDNYDEISEFDFSSEPEIIKKIAKETLTGLQALHTMGVIHRDVKTQNILLSQNDDIKLIDYGFSRNLQETRDGLTSSSCGTQPFAAPEILLGKEYGKSVDVYSLAASVYFMAFNITPFQKSPADDPAAMIKNFEYFDGVFNTFEQYHKIKKWDGIATNKYVLNDYPNFWDFLNKTLEPDPKKRLTVEQALQHPFLQ